MAYPTAIGVPSYSGNYIPNLFAKNLLVYFYMTTVLAAIANTDYEGTIRQHGDKVTIATIPDPDIDDYVKGQGITYQWLEPSSVDLLIDQGKNWKFKVNIIDLVQSHIPFVSKWRMHAGRKMAEAIDAAVLASVYSDVHASNKGATAGAKSSGYNLGTSGTPVSATSANMHKVIVDCGSVLDEQSVPEQGRYIVLPPVLINALKKGDLIDASKMGDPRSVLRNGRVGEIDRFTVFASNQIAKTTDGSDTVHNCIFGHKLALTFASQVVESRMMPDPNDHGDLVRGLKVYGFKVVKPEGIGHLYAKRGTDS